MEHNNVEHIFSWVDETAEQVQHQLNQPYLDSVGIVLEYLFTRDTAEELNDVLKRQLEKRTDSFHITSYEKEEIRKGIQLAILKGMKGATQQQHLITPDTVAMFIGYLAGKLFPSRSQIRLLDPASGTGNLITAVVNQLKQEVIPVGSEVDPSLLRLSVMSANLQQIELELFHQDSLRPMLLEPVDLVVSDLPVGYYPDDIIAREYELKADEGHSYSHHLFIEQSLRYLKSGGYAVFVIPNFLFDSDQADKLNAFLHKNAHIIGLVQLPDSLFASEKQAKSILILQKKGTNTKQPKQALLAKLPSFKNGKALDEILNKINRWFKEEGFPE
ncbi:class I SAM-dependent methyltransferase [Sediminibacillus massiliensis]|uniref:class I SAM-dependent methyltransferase n=1 Tax=Sediminibacillus massiliensis TaxID=1926277 RepID=UPI0009887003|nr:class I SAM-dependent methyltransferase [Sediminibacillus massiliensis]